MYHKYSYFVRNTDVIYSHFENALNEEFGDVINFTKVVDMIKEHCKKGCFFLAVDEIDKISDYGKLRSMFSRITPHWDDRKLSFLFYGSALAVGPLSAFRTYSGRCIKVCKFNVTYV